MLVVIGKSLNTHVGHQHTEIAAIRDLSGVDDFPIVTRRGCAPVLTDGAHDIHAVLATEREGNADRNAALATDVAAVLGVLDSLPDGRPVDILIPSTFPLDLRTTIAVLKRTKQPLRIHMRVLVEWAIAALDADELDDLRMLEEAGRVAILTETPALSRRLASHYGLPASDHLVLPCALQASERAERDAKRERYRVGFLGAPRRDKGPEQIPAIIHALRRHLRSAEPALSVEMVVQVPNRARYSLRHLKYDLAIFGAKVRSGQLRVSTYAPAQAPEAFETLLRSMDVLLLPYKLDAYRYRGSGLVIDGVMAGVPIVHTKGMAMAEYLEHGNALAATGADGFAAAIIEACRRNAEMRAKGPLAQAAFAAQLQKARDYLRALPA